MARQKQKAAKQLAREEDELSAGARVMPTPEDVESALNDAHVTQVIHLGAPEESLLTAFFGEGSKVHSYLWPGDISKIGHTPHSNSRGKPPLRSALYIQHPELVGKVYSVPLREMERVHPGISRRWKKVCFSRMCMNDMWLYRPSRTAICGKGKHG